MQLFLEEMYFWRGHIKNIFFRNTHPHISDILPFVDAGAKINKLVDIFYH